MKIDQVKNSITLVREVLIVLGILVLVLSPATIKRTLKEAGIKSIAGIEFKEDLEKSSTETKQAINEINAFRDSLDLLKLKLEQAMNNTKSPETRKELASIQSTVTKTTDKAEKIDTSLRGSLSRQEDLIEQFDRTVKAEKQTGWVFLGYVNEEKSEWIGGGPATIIDVGLPIKPGTSLKITTDTYLRKDGADQLSTAEILSVIKTGESVDVLETKYSHARRGGWFLWAKIRR